jgi:hypothetical protein
MAKDSHNCMKSIFCKISDKKGLIFHKDIQFNATFGSENKVTWPPAGAQLVECVTNDLKFLGVTLLALSENGKR